MQTENTQYSALTLAYIGDAVYELLARERAVSLGEAKVKTLHARSVELCSAAAQARLAKAVFDTLSREEKAVFMRGRNAKPRTTPKSASGQDYALATALEALFGWLHINGRIGRVRELWSEICEHFEGESP